MSPDLRDLLAGAAATEPVPLSGPRLRRAAERRRVRQLSVAVVVAVLAALAIPAAVVAVRRIPVDPANGRPHGLAYPAWPATGDLAGDPTYANAAEAAWNTDSAVTGHGPHSQVHVLYATSTADGPLVVVTGLDKDGRRRVAALRGSPYERSFSGRLRLDSDQPGPDPGQTRVVLLTMLSASAKDVPVAVVAEPFTTGLAFRTDAGASPPVADRVAVFRGWLRQGARVTGTGADGTGTFRVRPVPYWAPPYPTRSARPPDVVTTTPFMVTGQPFGWEPRLPHEGRDDAITRAWNDRRPDASAIPSVAWESRLPDGAVVGTYVFGGLGEPGYVAVAVHTGSYVDFYVDSPVTLGEYVPQISAVVRGARDRWLVVVGDPAVTRIAYDLGDGFRDAPLTDATTIVPAGSARTVRIRTWIGTRLTYDGPVTSAATIS